MEIKILTIIPLFCGHIVTHIHTQETHTFIHTHTWAHTHRHTHTRTHTHRTRLLFLSFPHSFMLPHSQAFATVFLCLELDPLPSLLSGKVLYILQVKFHSLFLKESSHESPSPCPGHTRAHTRTHRLVHTHRHP